MRAVRTLLVLIVAAWALFSAAAAVLLRQRGLQAPAEVAQILGAAHGDHPENVLAGRDGPRVDPEHRRTASVDYTGRMTIPLTAIP